jgi:mono/diheme cytochrome c family protein
MRRGVVMAKAALLMLPLVLGPAGVRAQGPMSSSQPPASAAAGGFDVHQLFANTCGWCHSHAGREAGKGPQLMGTTITDEQIVYRIKNGKQGAMPAFGESFSDAQLKAIVKYIRELKPEGASK